MSQRKSPVVQHTLTGPRGPASRGRSHRPQSKGNLYIANPDSDSDSDDAQRSNGLRKTPTPVHPFGSRSSATSDNSGPRNETSGSQAGPSSSGQGHPLPTGSATPHPSTDREWQQQRQQIARGLTVVTQPPTPGMTGMPGFPGHRNHGPDHVAMQYQSTMGMPPTVMTGMPLGPTSLRHDVSSHNDEHAVSADPSNGEQGWDTLATTTTNTSISPLNTTYGAQTGDRSLGTRYTQAEEGKCLRKRLSLDLITGANLRYDVTPAYRQAAHPSHQVSQQSDSLPHSRLQVRHQYDGQQLMGNTQQRNINMQNLPKLSTPPAVPIQLPSAGVSQARHDSVQSSKPSPPLSSASSSIPPALPPRPSTSQQSGQQTSQQHSTTNSSSSLPANGRFTSSGALSNLVNPAVANVASPISLGSVPSPIQSSSPSSPSFAYPATRRISKAQQGVGSSPAVTHALPAIPQHAHSTGSVPSSKLGYVRLQVTVDNENFSVVDVSGVASSEAIMERVFAKLRFRDDDYPSLTMFRTDIGETPDVEPIGKERLFDVCKAEGDSKSTLR